MKPRTILHTSEEVEQHTPVAGVVTPLLTITTPEGATYQYVNPLTMLLKIFDTNGDQIPPNSYIYVFKRRPNEDFGQFIRKLPYAAYYDLDEGQQRDSRFARSTMHDIGAGISDITNPEDHDLELWLESPVAADLSQARTRVELVAREF